MRYDGNIQFSERWQWWKPTEIVINDYKFLIYCYHLCLFSFWLSLLFFVYILFGLPKFAGSACFFVVPWMLYDRIIQFSERWQWWNTTEIILNDYKFLIDCIRFSFLTLSLSLSLSLFLSFSLSLSLSLSLSFSLSLSLSLFCGLFSRVFLPCCFFRSIVFVWFFSLWFSSVFFVPMFSGLPWFAGSDCFFSLLYP